MISKRSVWSISPTTFAACCEGRGKCVPSGLVPEEQAQNLGEDTCGGGEGDDDDDQGEGGSGQLCVANELLAGAIPPPCTADGFLIGEYSGVCVTCVDLGIQGLVVAQGTCDDDYECVPCENPLTGEPTGAPGCPGT